MNTKRVVIGIGFFILAGLMIYSRIANVGISTANIILGIVSVLLIASGVKQKNFFLILIPLAFMSRRILNEMGMFSSIGMFETIGVSVLCAAGLTMIFGSGKKNRLGNRHTGYVEYDNSYDFGNSNGTQLDRNRFVQHPDTKGNEGSAFGDVPDDGDNVIIDNGFGKLTRYIHSTDLKIVKIHNGFGSCIVYYDNVNMDDGSLLEISNGMGQVDVYIPPFYRFRMKQNNGFGSINVFGNANMDPDAPLIDAKIENGMGRVNIYLG